MDKKELNITIPEGYEIDKENSTFEKIVFKKVKKRWRDDKDAIVKGFFIGTESTIQKYFGSNKPNNYNIFATEKQAKRAIAEACISQIMINDKRFGGIITDNEWSNFECKYTIIRRNDSIIIDKVWRIYQFLAFHTSEQRDLFMEENMDLIKDYFMMD